MKQSIKYIFSLFAIATFGLASCGDSNTQQEVEQASEKPATKKKHVEEVMLSAQQFEALQMKTNTLQERKMSGFVEANGQLEVPPQNEAMVTSVVGANVVSIEVIEGDEVKKGQILAYLSHPNIIDKQTQYFDAYSNRQFLQKEYERQQKLYEAGVGSGMNFQKTKAQYQAAKSLAQGLKAQLQQLNINAAGVENGTIYQRVALRSPIAGAMQKVQVKTGQYVDPQTNLFEIVNTHHVHADLMVFEKDVYKVKKGQTVTFNVQSIPGKELKATIYSVGQTFEENPKALHVHAEIENKEGHLIPGMYIQGRIQTDDAQTKALPESAIGTDGDKKYAFTVEKEGDGWSIKPVKITTGAKDGEWIAVSFLAPLAPDTQLAYNNAYYLLAEWKKGEAGHSH